MKQILFISLLLLVSCNFTEETSQKEIAHLYVDILVAEETYKTDADSMQIALDSLYKFHNISESKYLKELENYSYDEDAWKEFFNLSEEYLDTLKAIEKRKVKKES